MSIKNRIIKMRKELGLNQTELAKKAGLQPPAISQYESGLRNPSYDALVKLSHAFNTKVDYLVSGVENLTDSALNPKSEVLLKIFQNMESNEKESYWNIHFYLWVIKYTRFLSADLNSILNGFLGHIIRISCPLT
jgi:transcriptional regulator with XRE-family HTH domain